MKKLLILSLIAIVALTGCGYEKGDNALGNNFVVKSVVRDEEKSIHIVIDKKSGVNYYWIASGQGISLCPIYDKEGKVVVDKVE